jgi:hypothetical protein
VQWITAFAGAQRTTTKLDTHKISCQRLLLLIAAAEESLKLEQNNQKKESYDKSYRTNP